MNFEQLKEKIKANMKVHLNEIIEEDGFQGIASGYSMAMDDIERLLDWYERQNRPKRL